MKMIGKKLVSMVITLLVISFLVFLAFAVIPGDPALHKLGTEATPEKLQVLREQMGLNKPLLIRYFNFLAGAIKGDFGTSYSYNMPVSSMIGEKLPVTLTLSVMSLIIMVAVSVLLGIYTSRHQGNWVDRFIYIVNQVIMSIPPFFGGILLTILFGFLLHWFTPGGYVSYKTSVPRFLGYLVFPAIAVALPKTAMAVKLLRSSLMEEMKKDYVRTAYSRGNRTKGVYYHHVLKNALIPVITFWGMAFTDMMVGSIIVEQVFGIPGLGRILLSSISNRDYPVVVAVILYLTLFIVVTNFIVDVIYRIVDPRISGQ